MNDDAHTGCTSSRDRDEHIACSGKALGHPARVRIVRLLLSRSTCCGGEIFDTLPLAQSTVSQHLKILRKAGLIGYEPRGTRGCYWARRDALARFTTLLGDILDEAVEKAIPYMDCQSDEGA